MGGVGEVGGMVEGGMKAAPPRLVPFITATTHHPAPFAPHAADRNVR
mgnify:CR=1 FL=1